MNADEVIYFSLLASESGDYCCQDLKGWSSDQLFATIRLAHSLVDQDYILFGEVQSLINICTELALPCIPEGHDDFTPPFDMNQVVSLVWLFADDPADFCEHYSACSPQVVAECIVSAQTFVRQGDLKAQFVQPILSAWSEMMQSAPAKQTNSANKHQPTQMYVSPSPMSTSVAAQYTLLPTKYSYPVSAPCTYPAFNPPASSQLPTNPQELPPATVASSLPYPNPPFQSAVPLTYRASVAKPKKKLKFFPTKTILPVTQPASAPVNPIQSDIPVLAIQSDVPVLAIQSDVPVLAIQSDVPVPVIQSDVPVPVFQPEMPVFQPEVFQPEGPVFQPEVPVFQPEVPVFQPEVPVPTLQPDVLALQPDVCACLQA
ncbi:hypothetical protein AB205_0138040 [Aquarana catesbeiana]|uniref:Uncharacterized protein n=1 Tax=Aquarana catesbeiana TaxID=8400 RepID=A0A2G9Q6D0_AQUCT|nr:hypothetical protein AB205_0138040 [Aquarana catesbeiana]